MATTDIRLTKPSEWVTWHEDFVARAKTSKIFKYVDIEQKGPSLEEPEEPLTDDEYLTLINKTAHEAWAQAQTEASREPEPSPLKELSTAHQTKLDRQHAQYKVKMVTYTAHQRAYAELAAWVRSTVDRDYLGNTSSDDDLRVIVQELKSSIAPAKSEQVQEARFNYRQVLAQTKRVKAESWLVAWNKARLQGEKLGIPELQGSTAIDDFLMATSAFDSAWAKNYRGQVASSRKKESKDGYSLRELAELFQEEVRQNRNAKLADSVFSATTLPAESKCPCGMPHAGSQKAVMLLSMRSLEKATDPSSHLESRPARRLSSRPSGRDSSKPSRSLDQTVSKISSMGISCRWYSTVRTLLETIARSSRLHDRTTHCTTQRSTTQAPPRTLSTTSTSYTMCRMLTRMTT